MDVDVDRGQLVRRRLEDIAGVMDLDELTPVGGRPARGRDRRQLERFTEVRQDLPNRTGLRDEGKEPDVATARRARKKETPPTRGP